MPGFDVKESALITGAFADISEAIRTQHVHRSRQGLRFRTLTGHENNTLPNFIANSKCQTYRCPIVEQADLLAVDEIASHGLVRMEHTEGLALALAQEADA